MSDIDSFYDFLLKDIVGDKNPDYVTRMFFITNYLMSRNRLYRRRRRRGL